MTTKLLVYKRIVVTVGKDVSKEAQSGTERNKRLCFENFWCSEACHLPQDFRSCWSTSPPVSQNRCGIAPMGFGGLRTQIENGARGPAGRKGRARQNSKRVIVLNIFLNLGRHRVLSCCSKKSARPKVISEVRVEENY
jgi:hypothetical protein